MTIHVVEAGDNIYSIAASYGVSTERLIYDNQLTVPDRLVVGQALLVLFPEQTHRIRAGETLFSIANIYGIEVRDILRNNPFLLSGPIRPGAADEVLSEGSNIVIRYRNERSGSAFVNGYAYPFINRALLEEELLYISQVSIFSYGFTVSGELIPLEDEPLIELALSYGVDPVLVLTPLDEKGAFNNYLVHVLVTNPDVQQRLIDALLEVVESKSYAGVDIDFEYIEAQDRNGYSAFVGRVREVMNAAGYRVSVAMAPKESADFPGLLYEGIDYPVLGRNANNVLLMTYEWGYTYGPPMAIAPINKVRQIIEYGITEIPSYKINMGIPNYAYDWALPYERGVTRARNISNVEAVEIAAANGVPIQFDTLAQSPFFEYMADGIQHEVWFEDPRSINQKLLLVPEYRLMGVGYWSLMKPFRSNWLLLHALTHIQMTS